MVLATHGSGNGRARLPRGPRHSREQVGMTAVEEITSMKCPTCHRLVLVGRSSQTNPNAGASCAAEHSAAVTGSFIPRSCRDR
jgi:hypothetical protein